MMFSEAINQIEAFAIQLELKDVHGDPWEPACLLSRVDAHYGGAYSNLMERAILEEVSHESFVEGAVHLLGRLDREWRTRHVVRRLLKIEMGAVASAQGLEAVPPCLIHEPAKKWDEAHPEFCFDTHSQGS